MALYVLILKEAEDEFSVTYKFGPDENNMGLLQVSKDTGEAKELVPVPIPRNNPKFYFTPAAMKLYQWWQKGDFPERTSWAS